MQRTHSSNSIIKFFLFAIALVASTFASAQAQTSAEKPVQTPERVGVETADAMPLSLTEAIRLALENNNDIRTSRIDVEKAEHNLTARRGAYDPQLFSETYFERSSTPVASFLGGNNSGSLEQRDFTGKIGLTGLFGIWFKGDPSPFLISSFLYLFCNVCFGAMAGASIPNQAAAIQAVQNVCFLLSFLLSGFVFPLSNIPSWLRWISDLVPARYFIEVSRDVFVRGGGWPATWHVPILLAVLSAVFLFKGWMSLRKMQIEA